MRIHGGQEVHCVMLKEVLVKEKSCWTFDDCMYIIFGTNGQIEGGEN